MAADCEINVKPRRQMIRVVRRANYFMSTCIDLDDGRSWWAANWAYDAVIESIAAELCSSTLEQELAAWLRMQTCAECGPGLGSLDVRELSPGCRLAFRKATRQALQTAATQGGSEWQQPEFFPGWIGKFRELVSMMDAIDRREPIPVDVHPVEPTGDRVGPGWQISDEH